MGFTAYTLEHYNKSMELKKNGLGSLRISKILNIKSRNAVKAKLKFTKNQSGNTQYKKDYE